MKFLAAASRWAALLTTVAATSAALLLAPSARAQFYRQDNLVSDVAGIAPLTDPLLKNPWGVSFSPTSPFWVSNAGTKTSTLYHVNPTTGVVSKVPLDVAIPGMPTGQVFNPTGHFVVSAGGASGSAAFIFAALNGTISGWNPGVPPPPVSTSATLAATGAPAPVVYTGLAMGMRGADPFLYAANAAAGRVDVFDRNFVQVTLPGDFHDPDLPAGYVPFNIVSIGGQLYVTFTGATQGVPHPGFVDIFDTDGVLVKRFATAGPLVNPWGMAVAPPGFGEFGGALLVGNFNFGSPAGGPGWISAYDLASGQFLGLLRGDTGNPININGLWTLTFGNGGGAGNPDVLYFTAGIDLQAHGLLASLTPCRGPVISDVSATPNVLWPPNHKFRLVTVDYILTDNCDSHPTARLSVRSNEDNDSDDVRIVDAHHVLLRAERSGKGSGRIYTITISARDDLGLKSSATVDVTVPHDMGKHKGR